MYLWSQKSPSLAGMRGFRPNQAMNEVYGGYVTKSARLKGLGDDTSNIPVNPQMLFVGIGALALGVFLLGGKAGPALKRRKIARLASQRESISRKLRELEA